MIDRDSLLPMDVHRSLARTILEAAAPAMAGHAARAILAHRDAHGPADGASRRRWRRILGIAAQVASFSFSTEEDIKQIAAEHVNAVYTALKAREEISVRILAQKELCREPGHAMFPKPSCWTCGRNGAFQRAARIAAGTWTGPEAEATTGEDDDSA
jgi:hypothetical protein